MQLTNDYMSWAQANQSNTEERGSAILILTGISVTLVVILVFMRMFTRIQITKNFGPDDIAIVAALFPTMACAAITVHADVHCGWDRHIWNVTKDELIMSLKLNMAIMMLFSLACSLTRISMLLLVLRIMATRKGRLRLLAIGAIALICVEEVIFFIVVLNTCSPVKDYWTISSEPQQCINEAIHLLIAGLINTFNDFLVVLIPIPVVLKLKLPMRQRIVCLILFGAGFVVCIAGGARIAFLYKLDTGYDKTWLSYPAWICGTVELYLGVIATSIPAIKPLVTRHFPNVLGKTLSNHGLSSGGHSKGMEPYSERSMKSPLPHADSAGDLIGGFVKNSNPTPDLIDPRGNNIGVPRSKSRPLIPEPEITKITTHGMEPRYSPIPQLKRSHRVEGPSSKARISSFSTSGATFTPNYDYQCLVEPRGPGRE